MKILMISIDKGLLGKGQLGDVVQRHKKYGEFCDKLDIIILSKKSFNKNAISNKVTAYPTNSLNKFLYYFNAIKIAKNLFKENNYDLIVCQEPFITGLVGLKLKKKFNTKFLVHFHGDFRLLIKKVIKQADGIRVMSQGQKDKLLKLGVQNNRIRIISTPIEIQRFENVESNNEKMFDQTILVVARKHQIKDFKTLFEAIEIIFKKNLQAGLWLVGNYSKNDNIPLDKKRIKFTPQMDTQEMPNMYKNSDILVSSSKSESFGKVLVEANACGKPVVATATTGAKEIVRDGQNGFLVPIGDANEMAKKILYLLNNPDKAKKMGDNGRKLVIEKYSNNLNKVINFWQDIIK